MTGRDSHSILLQICGQQITATDKGQIPGQICDSEFLATDLRAELRIENWPFLPSLCGRKNPGKFSHFLQIVIFNKPGGGVGS